MPDSLAPDLTEVARQVAAQRTRQAVQPTGGRREGAISEWIARQGGYLSSQLGNILTHPEQFYPAPGNLGELAPLAVLSLRRQAIQPFSGSSRFYGGILHDMLNEEGRPVGYVDITHPYQGDPTRLYVNYIRSTEPPSPRSVLRWRPESQSIGLEDIRSLLPLVAKEYPGVTHVGGYRVSGARRQAEDVWIPLGRFLKQP